MAVNYETEYEKALKNFEKVYRQKYIDDAIRMINNPQGTGKAHYGPVGYTNPEDYANAILSNPGSPGKPTLESTAVRISSLSSLDPVKFSNLRSSPEIEQAAKAFATARDQLLAQPSPSIATQPPIPTNQGIFTQVMPGYADPRDFVPIPAYVGPAGSMFAPKQGEVPPAPAPPKGGQIIHDPKTNLVTYYPDDYLTSGTGAVSTSGFSALQDLKKRYLEAQPVQQFTPGRAIPDLTKLDLIDLEKLKNNVQSNPGNYPPGYLRDILERISTYTSPASVLTESRRDLDSLPAGGVGGTTPYSPYAPGAGSMFGGPNPFRDVVERPVREPLSPIFSPIGQDPYTSSAPSPGFSSVTPSFFKEGGSVSKRELDSLLRRACAR